MAKSELWTEPKLKPLGKFIGLLGAFPVKRGMGDRDAYEKAKQVVSDGKILGIFGENTRVEGEDLGEIYSGIGHFAVRANCQVVPVGMHISEKRKLLRRRGRVVIGEKIIPKSDPDMSLAEKKADVMARFVPALDEVYRQARELADSASNT